MLRDGTGDILQEDGRVVSSNKSASLRFRIQTLKNNNLGKNNSGTQEVSDKEAEAYRKIEDRTQYRKKGAIHPSSPAPGSWFMRKEN